MNKWVSLFLALILLLSGCAAPQVSPAVTTGPANLPPEATAPSTELPPVTVENPVNYVMISIGDDQGNYVSLTAYENEFGEAAVEYVGEVKKVGTFDLSVLHNITAEIEKSGLGKLNGQNIYEEGPDNASLYVSFSDGSYLGAGFSGRIPQEFTDGYRELDAFFQALTAHLPVYVPMPLVMGEVDEAALEEFLQILKVSGVEPLDMFSISQVPMDEYFTGVMGLSKTEGILGGTSCGPMMSTTAFSFVIATLAEDADPKAIAEDFRENIDWVRWVCVSADHALIARKGNMVLCLVSTGELYTKTAQGILDSGWDELDSCSR